MTPDKYTRGPEAQAYRKAAAQYSRAKTIHAREQEKGVTDDSVRQTRRMALAVASLQRAARKYSDAQHELFNPRPRTFTTAPGYVCGNAGCECSQRSTVTIHYRDGGK